MVFPARAGMSPLDPPRKGWVFCVPRASGDEPPHGLQVTVIVKVFPARAGMSPFRGNPARKNSRVPRASGDEPRPRPCDSLSEPCSPRERG